MVLSHQRAFVLAVFFLSVQACRKPSGGSHPGAPADAGTDAGFDAGSKDTVAPTWPNDAGLTVTTSGPTSVELAWSAAADDVDVTHYKVIQDDVLRLEVDGSTKGIHAGGFKAGSTHTFEIEAGDAADNWSSGGPKATVTLLVPDPKNIAPPVAQGVTSTLFDSASFLFTGDDPLQAGVKPGTIEPTRIALIRGHVIDRQAQPIAGVNVSIADHLELGHVASRSDGNFELAVNGGSLLRIHFEKDGYIASERQLDVAWQTYRNAPDVVLVAYDTQVSTIDLAASTSVQTARASVVSDVDGSRQATVLFPSGAAAAMTLPDGSSKMLSTLHVRATEFTVGDSGPNAMPGTLPQDSAYTYAVELSVDEAVAVGAKDVEFSQPVYFYLENFLGYPAGVSVPMGYYDHAKGAWIASDNGLIIAILSITSGRADLDVDGSGTVANARTLALLNVTDAERAQLASLYKVGQSLWRAPVQHFSEWDANWGWAPDCEFSECIAKPHIDDPPLDDPCPNCGSQIDTENQTLGEGISILGTPFQLRYMSDRVPGHKADRSINIRLTGDRVPAKLKSVALEVEIAGQKFSSAYSPVANAVVNVPWDGKDVFGRALQGRQPVSVRVGNVFPMVRVPISQFGYRGNGLALITPQTNERSVRNSLTVWKETTTSIGGLDARTEGLGGWTLNVHHVYDPVGKTLFLGDGSKRTAENMNAAVTTFAGTGTGCDSGSCGEGGAATSALMTTPSRVAVASDGAVFILIQGNGGYVIRRVDRQGIITTITGLGTDRGDGPVATRALKGITDMVIAPDDSLYVCDWENNRVQRVVPDGNVTTVAGTGVRGFSGDGGPATSAQLAAPRGIALGSDGSLYIAEESNSRVRRVTPDGKITTVAGSGGDCAYWSGCGDGGAATSADLGSAEYVAVAPDGALYILGNSGQKLRRVGIDGIINTIGNVPGSNGGYGDGADLAHTQISSIKDMKFGREGSFYFSTSDGAHDFVRRVDLQGIVTTIVGVGNAGFNGDGGAATQTSLDSNQGFALAPDGSLYIADRGNARVRRVAAPLPGLTQDKLVVASDDGMLLHQFDARGRHLATVSTLTGATMLKFGYDQFGLVSTITDADGAITTIARPQPGSVVFTARYGQQTTLQIGADGYLISATSEAGKIATSYAADGLLTSMTEPGGGVHLFTYDAQGRLLSDAAPGGATKTLERTGNGSGHAVSVTTALGLKTTYATQSIPGGGQKRSITTPEGLITSGMDNGNFSTITALDGTVVTSTSSADPRFGVQAAYPTSRSHTLPSGLTRTVTQKRAVTLTDPIDPLSLATFTSTTTTADGRVWTETDSATAKAGKITALTTTQTSPLGRVAKRVRDQQGNLSEIDPPGGAPLVFQYDQNGRISTVTRGNSSAARSSSFAYGQDGLQASMIDPLGNTVTLKRDAAGRVTQQTLADGRTVSAEYDAMGNKTSLTSPGKTVHRFQYSPTSQLTGYSNGDSSTKISYDADRRPVQYTRADGSVISLTYDSGGNLGSMQTAAGKTSYVYSQTTGLLSRLIGPDSETISITYDGDLRSDVTWAGDVFGTVHRDYDNSFRLTALQVNGVEVAKYTYDGDGLMTQAGAMTLAYDPTSARLSGTVLQNVSTAFAYDSFGDLSNDAVRYSNNAIYALDFQRDNLGRIKHRVETIASQAHTYDYSYNAAGWLTDVKKDGAAAENYTYDANGNRTDNVALYNAQDQLLSDKRATYTYSANGELTKKTSASGTTTYGYDAFGLLTSMVAPDGTKSEFMFDAAGELLGIKQKGAWKQKFIYRSWLQPIAQLDDSGKVITTFIYVGGSNIPAYMVKNAATYRLITDQLGSIRLVVDVASGTVAQQIDYDTWGQVTSDTNPGFQPFGFAGGFYDQGTGLLFFGARSYDPSIGRWMSPDPLGVNGEESVYVYVHNDPVNNVDPTGLTPVIVGNQITFNKEWVEKGEIKSIAAQNPFGDALILNSHGKRGGLAVDADGSDESSGTAREIQVVAGRKFTDYQGGFATAEDFKRGDFGAYEFWDAQKTWDFIQNNYKNLRPGQPIVVFACWTARAGYDENFALQLAQLSGHEVLAYDRPVEWDGANHRVLDATTGRPIAPYHFYP